MALRTNGSPAHWWPNERRLSLLRLEGIVSDRSGCRIALDCGLAGLRRTDGPWEQNASIAELSPAVSDFVFKESTGYLALTPGNYDITVTPKGSKTVALGPLNVDLNGGGVYTVLARDEQNLGGVNVSLLDDFALSD